MSCCAPQRRLGCRELREVVLGIREQVAVGIERHLDRRVAE